jgi:hypothetical protein
MIQNRYSGYAKLWASAWSVMVLTAAAVVLTSGTRVPNTWNLAYIAVACTLAFLMVSVPLMHALDQRNNGFGLSHVYHADPLSRYQLDDTMVAGLPTMLAVRAAITLVILGGLLRATGSLHVQFVAQAIDWPAVLRSPVDSIFTAVVLTLAASIVSTMASLLCFDYSLRFDWAAKPQIRYALRKKAHRLSVLGFYWMMWSLVAAVALVDLFAYVLVMAGVFLTLWYYFFFSTNLVENSSPVQVDSVPEPSQTAN